jgi:thiol-disulfide isomerase/thioredoxin
MNRMALSGRALFGALVLSVCYGSVKAMAFSPASPPPTRLARGDQIPPFEAEGLDGVRHRVDYSSGSATVLLFFQSSCPKCQRMIPVWNRAHQQRPKGVQVYGLMLDQEPPGFFTTTPVAFPVLRAGRTPAERQALAQSFKVHTVPLTVRVLRGGRVDDVAEGLLDPIRAGELFVP